MTLSQQYLPTNFMRSRANEENANVEAIAKSYNDRYAETPDAAEKHRLTHNDSVTLTNEYYDLVTDFYEWGWGQAFHFAPRYQGESFYDSLARHEFYLVSQAGFKKGMKLIDIGSGVGGPLRNIARFTQAHITGINNNAYQIRRSKRYDAQLKLDELADYVRCDFNKMPLESNSIDGAYSIEAVCHSFNKEMTYGEIFRVMKPGACFVSYEWLLTKGYDHSSAEHRKIRHLIEHGNALPSLNTIQEMVGALEKVGFVVEEHYDMIERWDSLQAKTIPWYNPLEGNYTSLSGLRAAPWGRWFTSKMVSTMEKVGIAPKGSVAATDILEDACEGLVAGGRAKLFTPAYFIKVRKPATSSK